MREQVLSSARRMHEKADVDLPDGPDARATQENSAAVPNGTGDNPSPLFRPEVLRQKQNRWLGPILLEPRLSPTGLLSAALLILVGITLIVMLTTYTRKVRLTGWLVPDAGLSRIAAPFTGTVSALYVREGQLVRQGDSLLLISAELTSESGGRLGESIIESLQERRRLEIRERALQDSLAQKQLNSASERLTSTRTQQESVVRETAIVREQIRLTTELLSTIRSAFKKGLLTRERLAAVEDDVLAKTAALERLSQQSEALGREVQLLTASIAEIPVQRDTLLAASDRRILQIDQELAEVQARRSVLVKAPQAGVVSSIQVEIASSVPQNVPLITIVPENSPLVAHLYGPSRFVGLIQPSGSAFIRYEAFPYQRYGVQKGTVRSVSGSALGPAELPPQLSSFVGANANPEPVYRVVLELDRQDIPANSGAITLQPGLRLEADVTLESRKVYEWMISPIIEALTRPRP